MKTKTDNVYCTEEIEPAIWLSNDLETVISKNYQKGVKISARKVAFQKFEDENPLKDRREIIFEL